MLPGGRQSMPDGLKYPNVNQSINAGLLQWAAELAEVYADVEDVDFLVGTLAESPRPKGYLISNTAFYVFIMNASRRLLCDRFYQVRNGRSRAPCQCCCLPACCRLPCPAAVRLRSAHSCADSLSWLLEGLAHWEGRRHGMHACMHACNVCRMRSGCGQRS
jgi:hypothetical protein